MAGYIVRRLLWAAGTVVLTAFFAYGVIRLLRPELHPGESVLAGTWRDVNRALFHLTLGDPEIHAKWIDGIAADLYLLAGGLVVALGVGVAGGIWCATRARSRGGRAVESAALFFLCAPAYVVGLGTLLLFAPPFGLVQVPWSFEPHSYAPPQDDPWDFVRSMLVPWLVVGAPLAAAVLRLTLVLTREAMGEHWVRTARAKGLREGAVVRRHAAPASFATRPRSPGGEGGTRAPVAERHLGRPLPAGRTLDTMDEDFVRTARAKGVPHRLVVRRHAGPPTRPAAGPRVRAAPSG